MKDSFQDISASQNEKLRKNTEQIRTSFAFVDYNVHGKIGCAGFGRAQRRWFSTRRSRPILLSRKIYLRMMLNSSLYSRKAGDFIVNSTFQDAVNSAVRAQRLSDANISEEQLRSINKKIAFESVQLTETGDTKGADGGPVAAFVVAMLIYIVLAIYGQAIMSAIVEEKETRISEILFSSAKAV